MTTMVKEPLTLVHGGSTLRGDNLNPTELARVAEHEAELRDELRSLEGELPADLVRNTQLRELWQAVVDRRAAVKARRSTEERARQKREELAEEAAEKAEWARIRAGWQAKVSETGAYEVVELGELVMSETHRQRLRTYLDRLPDVVASYGRMYLVRRRTDGVTFNQLVLAEIDRWRTIDQERSLQGERQRVQLAQNRPSPSRFLDGSDDY